jgi:hypothetical protein
MTNRAIDQAVRAWIDASVVICAHEGAFRAETADGIMARHGITFEGDRARYLACEREIRARAYKRLGVDPRGRAHNARGGLAKVEPVRRREIARMGGIAKAAKA